MELLSITDLKLGFYGVQVLHGVTFSVDKGSLTGLIGPNGAGKTTLFNAISGLYKPSGGRVMLADKDITGLAPDALVRQGLVRSFQLARGFPKLTVFQHLMLYGQNQPGEVLSQMLFSPREVKRHEEQLAEKACETAKRLRLDHVLDNPVTALSGGQKKLVEIGRALMAEPSLILLDEPMAGVNPALTDEIAGHLQILNDSGITILLIEHDMALIKRLCQPVIVLAEGKTLTQGTFAQVASDERVQEAYLGRRQ